MRSVTKRFAAGNRGVTALHDANLDVLAGEFVAVSGPSGSGKSTLLHVAGGLLVPDEGTVDVVGEPIVGTSDTESADARRRRVGFVFQFFNLLPNLTAWENVALPGVLDRSRLRDHRERASGLLARFGLEDALDARPSELSGGQMQRVAVARALLLRPPVVLADEPTGNLDQANSGQVIEALRNAILEDGVAVVMVTHDPTLAESCDRQVSVLDGVVSEPASNAHGPTLRVT
jgi:ABC-type lipoprotein export system ATPase subunit